MLRFSPMRSNRYSMPFAPPSYGSIAARKPSEQLCPCGFAFTSRSDLMIFGPTSSECNIEKQEDTEAPRLKNKRRALTK